MSTTPKEDLILKEILDKMLENCLSIVDLIKCSQRYGYITSERTNKIIEAINDSRKR